MDSVYVASLDAVLALQWLEMMASDFSSDDRTKYFGSRDVKRSE